jgi:hypothetical protein
MCNQIQNSKEMSTIELKYFSNSLKYFKILSTYHSNYLFNFSKMPETIGIK